MILPHFHKKYFIFLPVFLVSVLFFQIIPVFAHESEKENAVIIHVNEGGFEPNTINIKIGTEVVFENTGTEEHWPASDDHPSHTLYDGTSLKEHCSSGHRDSFDSCVSIKSGETWSFIFTKEGVYEYHDHLWPQLTGEVVVGDNANTKLQKESIFSRFLNYLRKIFFGTPDVSVENKEMVVLKSGNTNSEFYTNLKNRFEKIVSESGAREAIDVLRDESAGDSKTMALCHDVLHVIGHTAYGKYGGFKEAVQFQEDFCNSGYIHGLFESYFKLTKDPLVGLSAQCSDYGVGKRPFDLWQCHHGVGHGFMYLTGGDLDRSLASCTDGLKEKGAVSSCQNGVFMELFNLEILAKEKSFVNPENPFLTCRSRQKNKEDCYLYIPAYLSQTVGTDFVDIFKECEKAEGTHVSTCINGIGAEAMKRNMNDPDSVFSLCKKAGAYKNQEACVSGAVSIYMNQEGSYSSGKKLCTTISGPFQDICNETVDSRESFFK